jgi:monovalent cation:H+ antiporter, CPA1 family
MEQSGIITSVLIFAAFLAVTSLLRLFTKRITIPYAVGLLAAGFLLQILSRGLALNINLTLSPEIIYYILLPILLFEAAIHINLHQFKLQFRTITFLATFGLLVSILIVGSLTALLTGMPLGISFLFGALISATDPLSVLSVFKSLGAPKRLSLLADGESMFNDATAVITYKIILALLVAGAVEIYPIYFLYATLQLVGMFLGSMVFGFVSGYITSRLLRYIKKDRLVETTITVILALSVFVFAEHYFSLSGVISLVIAGITLGNAGKTTVSEGVFPFIKEIWNYFGYLALSFVFIVTAYNFDFSLLVSHPVEILYVIIIVLLARSASVYLSFAISNRGRLFKYEPNVPVSWQHVLNWGGLRGVIPLVLALSLPLDFPYYQELLGFTLVILLFSMFVNGLTIERLLIKLGLHIPVEEESIVREETRIFDIERIRNTMHAVWNYGKLSDALLKDVDHKLRKEERSHQQRLSKLARGEFFESSLKLEALRVERIELEELFSKGVIPETVYYSFEAELDLQQDALEYPEVYSGRGYTGGGRLSTRLMFRVRQQKLQRWIKKYPFLSLIFGLSIDDLIANRYALHCVRIITSNRALLYLASVYKVVKSKQLQKGVENVEEMYKEFINDNTKDIKEIVYNYPRIVKKYHQTILASLVERGGY